MGANPGRAHFNQVIQVNRFISTVIRHMEKGPSGPQNSSPTSITAAEPETVLGKFQQTSHLRTSAAFFNSVQGGKTRKG